ncbi:beta strand repeat-containing protein, partial [Salmonella enterica]
FDDSAKSDKGWTQDYTLADLPNHGWVFNNTSVTAGGDVSLKGAGFTNSVVTITNGNLSIDNGGPAPLTGTTLTVDGGVNVHAGAGSIDLKNGNISAKGNITLKADAGSIAISGTNASVKANITSTEGGVNLVSMQAINITNANFLADKDISLNVASEVMGTLGIGNASFTSQSGDVDLFLDTKKITPIIITTDSQYGGLIFSGENSFEAKNINISALSSKDARGFSLLFESGAILNLKGETHINASNESDGTGRNDAALGSRYRRTQINVSDGDLYITASALSGTGIFGLVTAGQWADAGFEFVLNNSDLYIDANSKFGNGITLGCYGGSTYINGLTFKGNGNVSVHAQGGGYGITLSRLYTGELDGNVQLTGIGGNGAGIDASINTVFQGGVSLSGSSADDVGVSLSFGPGIQEHNMNLNGSNVTGSSENGSAGILIEGKNISFTNGTLTGTATSGNGSGVVLTGGSNYTLDGASVTGTAADGSGIAVNGTLTVNNGTVVKGLATGGGNGVTVSGDLVTDSGDGISITGTAFSGDGVKVDGDTTLTNAMLNGRADSGNGVNIAGNLTTDSSTQVSGHAASGTGVNLGAALTGASVKGSSDTGTGVQLADNAVVTEAVLNGSSTSGDGVTFTGNVKMDDTSAAKLNASSTSGTGLKLADNANVSIQTITKVTQEKKDADGN